MSPFRRDLTRVSTLAMKAATSTTSIVFAIGADPVKLGLVASLNHPGGNFTGVSFFTSQMDEIAPKVHLIAVLLNPNNPFFDDQLSDLDEASPALGLKIHMERAEFRLSTTRPDKAHAKAV
jgi:putative ABC transport system substrate-binding protein